MDVSLHSGQITPHLLTKPRIAGQPKTSEAVFITSCKTAKDDVSEFRLLVFKVP